MTIQRTALITGANRGLGRAVAAELLGRGLRVVLTARDGDAALAAAAELGTGAVAHALDVTDTESVKRAAEDIGPVDVLVSNAGVLLDVGSDPLSVSLDLVQRTFAVNLLGSWRVAQAFVPDMVRRGWGRVVFISSGTGSFSHGLFTASPGYSVSKTAVNGLTQMLAAQTEGTGVLVNAVNPGPVRTRMMPGAQRTAEEAARDIAEAATLPDGGPTGTFRRGDQTFPW
ncbi:SDR family NAD(P)-dependent oxidoreductase [Streptomyces sp. H10-C2]|uniref:SDR family NAD(P)-dependent oxidoreductase n=1 Tax=unclassified Streptomyces TaxID=2593676 RepID=UPI0024BBC4B5|nr:MULTISPECIES: SDR family NAD(P)-dependent oxidoreductase [unclassified Streptomyces]MDJ0345998.1 SDR family NAD(P)-dependent oxidoreductase [Streptomyces sp. PH10-H1]MDJ0370495.1 SDR family NAD(P)-dependent oxidoreductase [Streptomyces sp. H10-C2]